MHTQAQETQVDDDPGSPDKEIKLQQARMTSLVEIADMQSSDPIIALKQAESRGFEPVFVPTLVDLITNPANENHGIFYLGGRLTPSVYVSRKSEAGGVVTHVAHIPTGVIDLAELTRISSDNDADVRIHTGLLPYDSQRLHDLDGMYDASGRSLVSYVNLESQRFTNFKIKDVLNNPGYYGPIFPFFGGRSSTLQYFSWIQENYPKLSKRKINLFSNCSERELTNFHFIYLNQPSEHMSYLFCGVEVSDSKIPDPGFIYITKGEGYEIKAEPSAEHVLRIAVDGGYMGLDDIENFRRSLSDKFQWESIPKSAMGEIIDCAKPHLSKTSGEQFALRVERMYMYF